MAGWHFQQHDGYGDITQSSSAEAFEGSTFKELATCVVRESVQNVLDVSLDRAEPARVRFTLIEPSASESTCAEWFDGLMHHLQQPGAGVRFRSTITTPRSNTPTLATGLSSEKRKNCE